MIEPEKNEKALILARRINNRWIVHGRLRDHTNAWLDHLAATDPDRLVRSCEIAVDIVHEHHHRGRLTDPKPLFYAGLFALATPSEIDRFLGDHDFTRSVVLRMLDDDAPCPLPSDQAARLVAEVAGIVSRAVAAVHP